jgi:hypothetical protein
VKAIEYGLIEFRGRMEGLYTHLIASYMQDPSWEAGLVSMHIIPKRCTCPEFQVSLKFDDPIQMGRCA